MNPKLESKLFKKYPKIFRQKDLPMNQTCMCWGISCGDGWYNIIDTLCALIQFDIDNNKHKQLEAVQVKEKFGTLRFYTNYHGDQRQEGMISFAEYLSGITCESCGSMEDVSQTKGWIVTLCKRCLFKHENERYFRNIKYRILYEIEIFWRRIKKCFRK